MRGRFYTSHSRAEPLPTTTGCPLHSVALMLSLFRSCENRIGLRAWEGNGFRTGGVRGVASVASLVRLLLRCLLRCISPFGRWWGCRVMYIQPLRIPNVSHRQQPLKLITPLPLRLLVCPFHTIVVRNGTIVKQTKEIDMRELATNGCRVKNEWNTKLRLRIENEGEKRTPDRRAHGDRQLCVRMHSKNKNAS